MRTTLDLDQDLLKRVMTARGISQKTSLLHILLQEELRRHAVQTLIGLSGSQPDLKLERDPHTGKRYITER